MENEIGKCYNLVVLRLVNCNLELFAPSKLSSKLQVLSIQDNKFKDLNRVRFVNTAAQSLRVAESHYTLQCDLLELNLSQNKLSEFPFKALEFCYSLRQLDLSRNQISHLPPEKSWYPKMSNLQEIDLSSNRLSHFPTDLCHCQSLQELRLIHNEIKEIT